jgi:hypothetical protein
MPAVTSALALASLLTGPETRSQSSALVILLSSDGLHDLPNRTEAIHNWPFSLFLYGRSH